MYKPNLKVSQPANHINVVKTDAARRAGSVNDLIYTGKLSSNAGKQVSYSGLSGQNWVQYKIQILQNRQNHTHTQTKHWYHKNTGHVNKNEVKVTGARTSDMG